MQSYFRYLVVQIYYKNRLRLINAQYFKNVTVVLHIQKRSSRTGRAEDVAPPLNAEGFLKSSKIEPCHYGMHL